MQVGADFEREPHCVYVSRSLYPFSCFVTFHCIVLHVARSRRMQLRLCTVWQGVHTHKNCHVKPKDLVELKHRKNVTKILQTRSPMRDDMSTKKLRPTPHNFSLQRPPGTNRHYRGLRVPCSCSLFSQDSTLRTSCQSPQCSCSLKSLGNTHHCFWSMDQ